MALLTLKQVAEISADNLFQRRLYAVIIGKANYWVITETDPLLTKVAGQKYKTWASSVINQTTNRTLEMNALIWLSMYADPQTGENNPDLITLNGVEQPSDTALRGASMNGKFYTDQLIADWAGVKPSDLTTDITTTP